MQLNQRLSHAAVRDYLRDVHETAARLGAVDINILYVAGKPVAFIYNYCWRGNVFGLRRGFDATASTDGAGSVLLARVIEDSFGRGDRVFNLGAGYLESKRAWLTRIARSESFCHYPKLSAKAQAVRLARTTRTLLGRRSEPTKAAGHKSA